MSGRARRRERRSGRPTVNPPGAVAEVSSIERRCSRTRLRRWNNTRSSPMPACRSSTRRVLPARATSASHSLAALRATAPVFRRQTLPRWVLPARAGATTRTAPSVQLGQRSIMSAAAWFDVLTKKSWAPSAARWGRSKISWSGEGLMPAAASGPPHQRQGELLAEMLPWLAWQILPWPAWRQFPRLLEGPALSSLSRAAPYHSRILPCA